MVVYCLLTIELFVHVIKRNRLQHLLGGGSSTKRHFQASSSYFKLISDTDFINNSYQQLCSLEIIGFIQLSKFDRRVVNPSRRRLQTILLEILIKFRMHTQLFFWCYTAQMHFLHTSLSEVANACTQNSFTLLANTVFSTPDFITCIALVLLQKWCVLCVFSSTLQNRKGYLGWQLLTLFNIMQPLQIFGGTLAKSLHKTSWYIV